MRETILTFADRHLQPYTLRGDELIPDFCPICHGGDNRDRYTFALNLTEGIYVCKRGSCGARGRFEELARRFGEQAEIFRPPGKAKKQYVLPDVALKSLTDEIIDYFVKRKISRETLEAFRIGSDDKGNIVFPFYRDNALVYVKYRAPRKPQPKEKKEWQAHNAQPILFGMDLCAFSQPLIITEGQIDCLSLYEAGIRNVVSVPSGCSNLDWIDTCWEWLEKFQSVILFGDNDDPGRKMVREVVRRLDEARCMVVEEYPLRPDGRPCKDANEILFFHGAETLKATLDSAQPVPVKGIQQLADVVPYDPTTVPRIKTMIPALDEQIGGQAEGAMTVFTGKPGNGKLLSDDTPVLTSAGWKSHGDLCVGDQVVGLDGRYKRVTAVFPKDFADMKITFSNGEVIQCHHNHEWVIEYHSGYAHKQRIMTAGEMFERFQANDGYRIGRNGKKSYRFKLPCRIPMEGTLKDLPVAPYTQGAWLGDGRNTNPDMCSAKADYAVVKRILQDGYKISWQSTHKTTGCIYTGFKELRAKLQELGMCYSRRKTAKHIPEEYLTSSYMQRMELLAGLLDTDGHYDPQKDTYIYATCEPALRDGVIQLIATFGWNYGICCYEPKTSSSGVIGRRPCYSISFAPKDYVPCVLERKRIKRLHNHQRISIVSVERCEPVHGNCISVKDGIYCVGKTMLPTHNSTLTGQQLLSAIEQGYSVCAYSGELTKEKFQEWINLQCAGSDYIGLKYDPVRNVKVATVPYAVQERLLEYYRDRFYLFDNQEIFEANQSESILKVFQMAARRYGCKLFLADNLMTALSDSDEETKAQGKFANALKKFATRYHVHVLLVAHPRKVKQGEILGQDDIGGSSATIRLADSAIVVERPNLRVLKNRDGGVCRLIECCYCPDSRRIYQADKGDLCRFSWNREGITPPDPRADSLPEYAVRMAESAQPF